MAEARFHVVVHSEDDGSLWAEVEELPGCFASGFDLPELKEALYEAMQLWLPEGLVLGEPRWQQDAPKPGRRAAPKRQRMLVCA